MFISSQRIVNFRNFKEAEFSPTDGINLIYGRNGQGKTNLLESLFVTATAKSFRKTRMRTLLKEGETEALAKTAVQTKAGDLSLEIRLGGQSRTLRLNGNEIKTYKDFFGRWVPVLFTPEDHWLIKLGPEFRRPYFDLVLSFRSASYLSALLEYRRVLAQKKKLLSSIAAGQAQKKTLASWNDLLARAAKPLVDLRAQFCGEINHRLADIYRRISDGQEDVSVVYRPSLAGEDLFSVLESIRDKEIAREQCLRGPHRDEYTFFIDGRRLKEFASQGEQKTFLLSLKLFEIDSARAQNDEAPILLIDDLGSELDGWRSEKLLSLLKAGDLQTFITTTDPRRLHLPRDFAGKIWHVEGGRLTEKEDF